MVLLKRKAFSLVAPPTNIPENADVFVMRGTSELFTDYETYLKRCGPQMTTCVVRMLTDVADMSS